LPIHDRLASISSDLDPLSTGRAAALASVLHQLLVSLHFDVGGN
jgi:hypothetical protein